MPHGKNILLVIRMSKAWARPVHYSFSGRPPVNSGGAENSDLHVRNFFFSRESFSLRHTVCRVAAIVTACNSVPTLYLAVVGSNPHGQGKYPSPPPESPIPLMQTTLIRRNTELAQSFFFLSLYDSYPHFQ
jgi:hypothetical protein